MYVGLYQHGFYALPSYVDMGTTISRNFEHLLLEGPLSPSRFCDDDEVSGDHIFISNIDVADNYQTIKRAKHDIITLGKYANSRYACVALRLLGGEHIEIVT